MEIIKKSLLTLHDINSYYEIPTVNIDMFNKEILSAKVCTPIIGKFSSGKSALVNTLLGYSKKILKEGITPQTSIPAEIVNNDIEDKITIFKNDGKIETLDSVQEYRDYEADASTTKKALIELKNGFLSTIPDVMIVDMPGFESDYEIHNKAIDDYLPKSLAYIIAFPADDMTVKDSVGNILKELNLHDMPLCIVITKSDKNNEGFEESLQNLKTSLKSYIGETLVEFCCTSSFSGDLGNLKDFLQNIQKKSHVILANSFKNQTLSIAEKTENYLKTLKNNINLSESELDEKEEKMKELLNNIGSKYSKEKADFDIGTKICVGEIKSDIRCALEGDESTFVNLILNKQDIKEQMNTVVRKAATQSCKKRLEPKIDKYLNRVSKCFDSEGIGDVYVSVPNFNYKKNKAGTFMCAAAFTGAVGALAMGLPTAGLGIGVSVATAASIGMIGGPVVSAAAAGVAAVAAGIGAIINSRKKREEQKAEIITKLRSEVYPQVLSQIESNLEIEITKQINLINELIEKDISSQRATLEKAISDLRKQIAQESEDRENYLAKIEKDLKTIGELKNELQ